MLDSVNDPLLSLQPFTPYYSHLVIYIVPNGAALFPHGTLSG